MQFLIQSQCLRQVKSQFTALPFSISTKARKNEKTNKTYPVLYQLGKKSNLL